MRELTIHDLDAQLAEQLPARELMGRSCSRSSSYPGQSHTESTTINQGTDNGNSTEQVGLLNVNNVNVLSGDGELNIA